MFDCKKSRKSRFSVIFVPQHHPDNGKWLKRVKKSLFSKNLQNGQKSSKMVWDIKIAHFDPGSDGICPVVWLWQNFEKITIYGILGLFYQNGYICLGVLGHFFSLKMLLWGGIQGASKNPLGSLQLHGVLELWPPEVSILMENLRDGRPKIAKIAI